MVRPSDLETFKSLRIIRRSDAWEHFHKWLAGAENRVRAEIRSTTEPYSLNRLEGERETILTMLEEFESSAANEAAYANGSSTETIGGTSTY